MSFTPGPWSLCAFVVGNHEGWHINQEGGPGFIGTLDKYQHRAEECAANARLIAAAPDLLAALLKLANEAEACAEMARPCIGNTNVSCLMHRVTEARAAIAKATKEGRA